MYKILVRNILIITLPIVTFSSDFASSHKKFDIKNETNIEVKKQDNTGYSKTANFTLEDKIDNNFNNYQSFEDSIKPSNQFLNLFGVGGFSDQRLKDSSFKLWDTFEKEMSNQIGNQKLSGPDIQNTYNGSLKSIGN